MLDVISVCPLQLTNSRWLYRDNGNHMLYASRIYICMRGRVRGDDMYAVLPDRIKPPSCAQILYLFDGTLRFAFRPRSPSSSSPPGWLRGRRQNGPVLPVHAQLEALDGGHSVLTVCVREVMEAGLGSIRNVCLSLLFGGSNLCSECTLVEPQTCWRLACSLHSLLPTVSDARCEHAYLGRCSLSARRHRRRDIQSRR